MSSCIVYIHGAVLILMNLTVRKVFIFTLPDPKQKTTENFRQRAEPSRFSWKRRSKGNPNHVFFFSYGKFEQKSNMRFWDGNMTQVSSWICEYHGFVYWVAASSASVRNAPPKKQQQHCFFFGLFFAGLPQRDWRHPQSDLHGSLVCFSTIFSFSVYPNLRRCFWVFFVWRVAMTDQQVVAKKPERY